MKAEIGRLAMREEGDFWNAYWAPSQTSMQGALLLGSIRMSLAARPNIRDAFMEVMKFSFGEIVHERFGQTPGWSGERPAPESERSGRA